MHPSMSFVFFFVFVFFFILQTLSINGYHRYEVANFARPVSLSYCKLKLIISLYC